MPNTEKPISRRRDLHRKMTAARREAFLRAYAELGIFSHAAKAASPGDSGPGDCASSFRSLMDRDPVFRAQVEEAKAEFDDRLVSEAVRRGVDGVPEKLFTSKGAAVIDPETGKQATILRFSDRLLERLLESRVRDFVRKREVEVTGSISHAHVGLLLTPGDLAALDDAEKEVLGRLLRKIGIYRGELPAPSSAGGKPAHALPAPTDIADAEFEEVPDAELAHLSAAEREELEAML